MIRFSNAVSHSMVPFMRDYWGITISQEAADAVKFMPPWLPALGGIEGLYATTINTPVILDLRGEAMSHDGVAEVKGLTIAGNGIIEDTGTVFVYTPHEGFRGSDSFSYDVVSSTGHASTSTVEINVSNQGVLLTVGTTSKVRPYPGSHLPGELSGYPPPRRNAHHDQLCGPLQRGGQLRPACADSSFPQPTATTIFDRRRR